MPVRRDLAPVLLRASRRYPVVTVTGPRQSGKTTLCRAVFPTKPYVTFERIDERERVSADPRGFLADHPGGAVLDEVQHAPSFLSYVQADVDEDPRPGRWVLTGSQHLGLARTVSQTLAGRTALLHLLPLSLGEVRRFADPPRGLWATLLAGAYPRIHDQGIPSGRWLADYVATYVQRDVRQTLDVGDLAAFGRFASLCAGRTAQELNLSGLGADAGVSHNTARSWLSALEQGLLVFRVPAWHRNPRKRLVKAPKVHWIDSGLACHLLGISTEEQLRVHPLRGALFESWVASEVLKAHAHRGVEPRLHHVRETRGGEVDLLVEAGGALRGIECKSGATVAADAFAGLAGLPAAIGDAAEVARGALVYAGGEPQRRRDADVVPWDRLGEVAWLRGLRGG
jgi:predicted AAA+ superfamily ATPase